MFRRCECLIMARLCSMQRCRVIGSAANLFAVTQRLAPRMMRDKRGFNVTRANYRPAIRQANKGCIYTQKQPWPIMMPGPWKCRTEGETGLRVPLRLVCAALPLTARLRFRFPTHPQLGLRFHYQYLVQYVTSYHRICVCVRVCVYVCVHLLWENLGDAARVALPWGSLNTPPLWRSRKEEKTRSTGAWPYEGPSKERKRKKRKKKLESVCLCLL